MAQTQIKLNTRNLQKIMRGEEGKIRDDLDKRAKRVVAAAGAGHSMEGWVGRFRYRQNVHSNRPTKVSGSPLLAATDAARGGR